MPAWPETYPRMTCGPERTSQPSFDEPRLAPQIKENRRDIVLDLPEGLCCNFLHRWKKQKQKNLHHQIKTVAAQLIEMLQAKLLLYFS